MGHDGHQQEAGGGCRRLDRQDTLTKNGPSASAQAAPGSGGQFSARLAFQGSPAPQSNDAKGASLPSKCTWRPERFVTSRKSSKSKPGPTLQPTREKSPKLRAACQIPLRITAPRSSPSLIFPSTQRASSRASGSYASSSSGEPS